jgi:hypothetical protein
MTEERSNRQRAAHLWCAETFGSGHATDIQIRAMRMLEEACELAQACGLPKEKAQRVVDYVFARPAGKIEQEIGGLGVTLLVLSYACAVDADNEERKELDRVIHSPKWKFQQRNEEKIQAGLK